MIAIVTGGRGFIGHNLVGRLLQMNYKVYVIDNEIADPVSTKHIGAIYYKACCSYISNIDLIADIVFHLGEYSRVEESFTNSKKCLVNTISTMPYILDYCKTFGSKLIYAGSSTKFSSELSPYSVCKRLNTELAKWYCEAYNIPYAITYFYNVYGDLERHEGEFSTVVSKFIYFKNSGQIAEIHGDGNQERYFTHINDIVNGIVIVSKNGNGDNYGIGSDKKISIKKLAQMIGVNYIHIENKKGNRLDSELKTEKTKKLGWVALNNVCDYISSKL